jgi:hypothetical protein
MGHKDLMLQQQNNSADFCYILDWIDASSPVHWNMSVYIECDIVRVRRKIKNISQKLCSPGVGGSQHEITVTDTTVHVHACHQ